MDGSVRLIVGVFVVLAILGLLAYARGLPLHGEPTAPATGVVLAV